MHKARPRALDLRKKRRSDMSPLDLVAVNGRMVRWEEVQPPVFVDSNESYFLFQDHDLSHVLFRQSPACGLQLKARTTHPPQSLFVCICFGLITSRIGFHSSYPLYAVNPL